MNDRPGLFARLIGQFAKPNRDGAEHLLPQQFQLKGIDMSDLDVALKDMMMIDGAIGAAVVDYNSGMALGVAGSSKTLDLQVAAAGNTEVVRAKLRTIHDLQLNEDIEDILITLTSQYHLIRPMTDHRSQGLFLYMALTRDRANLALARHRLKSIEQSLNV